MKLPITTPRRYELAVLHHVPVIYNLVKQVYGTRGSSSNLLENIPTTTGFDMIRGWAAHVAQRAVALWLENGATASTPYPAVDIMHAPNAHCEVIASIMHTKIYNRRIREIAGMRVVAQLHKVPLFASLDPGLLRVPYSALTESEQAAVDQYRVDYAQYKSGARMPMPHPPRGSVSPVEHYRQVVEALHYQAGYHAGQYVINITSSLHLRSTQVRSRLMTKSMPQRPASSILTVKYLLRVMATNMLCLMPRLND